MVNLMLKPNYMLAKGTLAKSHCRTLDDGLLNRLPLKDDVVLSECAKLKLPRLSLGIVLTHFHGWMAALRSSDSIGHFCEVFISRCSCNRSLAAWVWGPEATKTVEGENWFQHVSLRLSHSCSNTCTQHVGAQWYTVKIRIWGKDEVWLQFSVRTFVV